MNFRPPGNLIGNMSMNQNPATNPNQNIQYSFTNNNNMQPNPPVYDNSQIFVQGHIKSEFNSPVPSVNSNSSSGGNYSTNITPDMAKKKCKNFLATLLKLSYHQPPHVSQSVKTLIQGLLDNDITPEQFTQRLQNELKSSPQPCLIPFLKKSLPYLQISMCQGDNMIEGIKPPALHALMQKPNNEQIQSLVSAITTLFNSPGGIGNLLISPQSLQAPQPVPLLNLGIKQEQILPQITQQLAPLNSQQAPTFVTMAAHQSSIPPLRFPVIQQSPNLPMVQLNPVQSFQLANLQHKIATSAAGLIQQPIQQQQPYIQQYNARQSIVQSGSVTNYAPVTLIPNMVANLVNSSGGSGVGGLNSSLKPIQLPNPYQYNPNASITPMQQFQQQSNLMMQPGGYSKTNIAPEPRSEAASPIRDEDDINDVTAMGGVNLSEEKQNILAGTSEMIGCKIRSCPDEELFLDAGILADILNRAVKRHGLSGYGPNVMKIISRAAEHRMRTYLTQLSIIAEHRMDVYKNDNKYQVDSDVKAQFKFLEEIDTLEKRRKDEHEKEMLYRMAKKSKHEDPEQVKLKQKVKEMQLAQLEEMRQMEANMTALAAIGPRKKKGESATPPIINNDVGNKPSNAASLTDKQANLLALLANNPTSVANAAQILNAAAAAAGTTPGFFSNINNPTLIKNLLTNVPVDSNTLRNRIKRVTMKDFIFLLEQDPHYCRSSFLYECYLRYK